MNKLFSAAIVTLLALLISALPGFAADNPNNLQGVMNLQHPTSSLYVSGQPKPDAFAAFSREGVKHVINLRTPEEAPELNEAAVVTQAGMTYYNIPIAGAGDLTRDNVRKLDTLLKKIGSEPVLIHCSSGNRAAALITLRAAWMQNVPIDDAIQMGKSYGLTKLLPDIRKLLEEPK